jgi:hypothetical protein
MTNIKQVVGGGFTCLSLTSGVPTENSIQKSDKSNLQIQFPETTLPIVHSYTLQS